LDETYSLDFSLPPAGVRLLPDQDHLPTLERQLLLPGGRVGRHHRRQLRLLRGLRLALKQKKNLFYR